MTPEQAAALRAPFPPEAIGLLPKPTRKDNPVGLCQVCGQRHGIPAVHLDYVGHAATTDRLLQVDPEWTWEPMALDDSGLPLLHAGGLWIRLTVAGVTRPGYGDGQSMKEIIGDAIRNAAMRFGVALDLWSKEDLQPPVESDGDGLPSWAEWLARMDALGVDSPEEWARQASESLPTSGDDAARKHDIKERLGQVLDTLEECSQPIADAVIAEAFAQAFDGADIAANDPEVPFR